MKQEFYGDTGCVVNGDVESIKVEGLVKPPTEPHQARICPQCEQATWRYTKYCVRCHFDLRSHDLEVQRLAQLRDAARQRRLRLKVAALFGVAGLGAFWLGGKLHGVTEYSWLISILGLLTAIGAIRNAGGR